MPGSDRREPSSTWTRAGKGIYIWINLVNVSDVNVSDVMPKTTNAQKRTAKVSDVRVVLNVLGTCGRYESDVNKITGADVEGRQEAMREVYAKLIVNELKSSNSKFVNEMNQLMLKAKEMIGEGIFIKDYPASGASEAMQALRDCKLVEHQSRSFGASSGRGIRLHYLVITPFGLEVATLLEKYSTEAAKKLKRKD
jgi:hypothetical protein